MVVDRRTVCERDQFVAYVDTAADHFQFFEMFESPLHGPLFGAQFRGVSFVGPAPFAFELHALPEPLARELLVPEIGVFRHETVDMVAFGLVPASREVAQVVGVVNVIFHAAVGFEREQPGVHVANHLAPLVRKPDDAQPLSVRMGIFAQGGDDPGEIPFADGLHVPDLLPAPDLEADHQEAVDHGPRHCGTSPASSTCWRMRGRSCRCPKAWYSARWSVYPRGARV